MSNTRLTKDDWIAAGFRALLESGPSALKAEALARRLGTTKGSFYWHFKDVPDFHARMIAHWEAEALTGMIDEIEKQNTPLAALNRLVQITASELKAEPAVRAWARSERSVADAVQQVDAARLKYLAALLKRCGVSNPELARALYAAALGMEDLCSRDQTSPEKALNTLVDLMLALR